MGYKPKYAAKNRKQELEVIRSPKPETKKQRPAEKPRSRAGNIAWMVLTAVLVQLTGTLTTITVQQTLYGKQKDGQTS